MNLTITAATQQQVSNWLEEMSRDEKKKQTPIVFPDDPIALVCAAHRRWLEHRINKWPRLEEIACIQEDRDRADDIRRYYGDRILLSMLKQQNKTTEFRRKLYGMITNSYQPVENDLGILYRLPYFYDEDLAIDRVILQTQSAEPNHGVTKTLTVEPMEKVAIGRRGTGECTHYWLRSNNDTAAYKIAVRNDNSLYKLLDSLLSKPVTLKTRVFNKHFQGAYSDRMYYQLADFELV